MANVSMRQMLEAGVHFGHQTRHWNPRMAPYIFGARGRIHIINLEETLPLFREAMDYLENVAANQGKVLFVGTKKAARTVIAEQAQKCGMPYVNHRWLGGMLTNFQTIKQRINRLKELESMQMDGSLQNFSKKEALGMTRELQKLENSLGGIKDMSKLPDVLFILDVGYEKNAIREAKKLGIPVVGIVDTNNDPNNVDYMIPGNDDSVRSILLYAQSASVSILEGKSKGLQINGAGDEFVEMDQPAETEKE
jgi:small subunit ribosomal protein S2